MCSVFIRTKQLSVTINGRQGHKFTTELKIEPISKLKRVKLISGKQWKCCGLMLNQYFCTQ